MLHTPTRMIEGGNEHLRFHERSWSNQFKCPTCEREIRLNTNFLGQRVVVCNGEKTVRIKRSEWRQIKDGLERLKSHDPEAGRT